MDGQLLTNLLGGLGESFSCFQILHRLGHVVLQQHGGQLQRGLAQAQDGQGDAAPAQLGRFVHTGHRQHIRPQLLQLFRYRQGSVAVGVRLAQAQEPASLGGQRPQGPVVVFQGGKVDLRPGPHLCGIHETPSSLSIRGSAG